MEVKSEIYLIEGRKVGGVDLVVRGSWEKIVMGAEYVCGAWRVAQPNCFAARYIFLLVLGTDAS